jgi:radical SAM protein with 4Fe4S-binding SPASM domain
MSVKLQWTKRINAEKVDSIYLKHCGDRYREYRNEWAETLKGRPRSFPVHLDIEVVDACNLRCKYCFRHESIAKNTGQKVNTGKKLPMDLYEKILKEAKEGGVYSINLGFSGECLLRKEIVDMINMADDAGILDIRVVTNGLLLTEEMADRLLDSKLKWFSISIDAGKPETYKKLKGEDGLAKLHKMIKYMANGKKLRGNDFPVLRSSYYLSPESKGEKDAFLTDLQDYLDVVDFKEFLDVNVSKEDGSIASFCRMPFQRLSVYANGNVSACCTIFYSTKMNVGNLYGSSLKEIWDSKEMRELRRDLLAEDYPPVCRKCLLRNKAVVDNA